MSINNESNKLPCRYCKQPIEKGDKRCPYCGTLNPSMDVKRSLIWTVSAIAVLYVVAYMVQVLKG
ncbi:MAG: hypothetical protein L3J47_08615 [Sulfurovum sp.]|nr:hypothetical protein [Sulfurovum sp.]